MTHGMESIPVLPGHSGHSLALALIVNSRSWLACTRSWVPCLAPPPAKKHKSIFSILYFLVILYNHHFWEFARLKKFVCIVCIYVSACMYVHALCAYLVPWEARRGCPSPWSWGSRWYENPDVGAGHWIRALSKSNVLVSFWWWCLSTEHELGSSGKKEPQQNASMKSACRQVREAFPD